MAEVYITRTSNFLPNEPVSNDEMEQYLGLINGKRSKSRAIVLRNNGIQSRYYALDKNGKHTHTNAQLVETAIRKLFNNNPEELKQMEMLSCGTTSPDQILPSHSVMVHGLLPETSHIEVVSPSGSCCSGMHALKYSYLSIKAGEKKNAVCAGSERLSALMKDQFFEEEAKQLEALEENPYVAFEKDFLRWMLSDGAAAFLLENKKSETGLSLRIDWIELSSFAHMREACMYMGGQKQEDGSLIGYTQMNSKEIINNSVLSLKQDTKLLSANIVDLGFATLRGIMEKHGTKMDEVDHFLPHMSSYFFQPRIFDILVANGIPIPYEKWYTNLREKGNVGAGSIYMMVDGLLNSGKLKVGDKILLAVPESARFSYAFCQLTVC